MNKSDSDVEEEKGNFHFSCKHPGLAFTLSSQIVFLVLI